MVGLNSVGSAQVIDGSIGSADLGFGAVGNLQLANGSVTTAKLAAASSVGSLAIGDFLGLSTSPTSLGSITLNLPAAGRVLLIVSGNAVFAGDNTMVDIGFGTSAGASDLHSNRFGRQDGLGTLRYTLAFSDMAVVSVPGGVRTFFLTANRESVFSANVVNLENLYVTAIYLPL